MDEPIVVLPGEVPQDSFALRAVAALPGKVVQQPELLAVSGSVFLELVVGQPPAESRLADARVAHQHDLGAGVPDCRGSGLVEQDGDVQLEDLNGAVTLVLLGTRVRTDRGKEW